MPDMLTPILPPLRGGYDWEPTFLRVSLRYTRSYSPGPLRGREISSWPSTESYACDARVGSRMNSEPAGSGPEINPIRINSARTYPRPLNP
jgi:hypothetical protein